MKIGSIVKYAGGTLASGACQYAAAIVACLDPFIAVSHSSDMKWSTLKAEDMVVIGMATPELINAIQHRLDEDEVEHQVRAPVGESFLSNQLGCGLTLVEMGLECFAVDLNERVKTWPSHGAWAEELAKDPNPSYGWLFRFDPEDNLWKAHDRCTEQGVLRYRDRALRREVVVSYLLSNDPTARGEKIVVALNPELMQA